MFRRIRLYSKLSWLFFISLFVPTATIQPRIEELLEELKDNPLKLMGDEM